MSESFSSKRDYIPHDISILSEYCDKDDLILDIGCGNGRLSEVLDCKYIGADTSSKMLEIAKLKYPDKEFVLSKSLNFPFSDNHFDKVFCLAVFHHIPSKRLRQEFLKEIRRVLKPQGDLILTVWELNNDKKAKKLKRFYSNNILYPFKDSDKLIAQRFIHLFNVGSLDKEVSRVFNIEEIGIQKRSEKGSNIFLKAKNLL